MYTVKKHAVAEGMVFLFAIIFSKKIIKALTNTRLCSTIIETDVRIVCSDYLFDYITSVFLQTEVFVMQHNTILNLNKTVFYIAVPLITLTCAILFFTNIRAESTTKRIDDVVRYESVLICRGDSLWSIARANLNHPTNTEIRAYVDEIVSLNKLTCTKIHTGNYILVPRYYDTEEKEL